MKAERRHELKTNSLSKGLENAPAFFQQYGSRILLGVILCLLAYILVQRHIHDKEEKARDAAKALGGALYALNELQTMPLQGFDRRPIPPEQLVTLRKEYVQEVESRVNEVLSNAEDPKVLAQAQVVKGDLNWLLANYPPLPGSATRPDQLNTPKASDEYLTAAADAYDKVLQAPLNTDHLSVVAARMSLGNISENRGDWAKARDYFQQVADDPEAGTGLQALAKNNIEEIKSLQKPVFVSAGAPEVPIKLGQPTDFGPALPPGFSPASAPGITKPATAASTEPSVPGVPSTSFSPTTLPSIRVPTTTPVLEPPSNVIAPTTRPSHP